MTYEDVTPKSFPFAKEFAAILPKSTEGKIYLRNTNAMPDTKTLTHHGYLTSRLSMDSSLRAMKCFLGSSAFFLVNQDSLKLIFNAMRYALCALRYFVTGNFFMDDPRHLPTVPTLKNGILNCQIGKNEIY